MLQVHRSQHSAWVFGTQAKSYEEVEAAVQNKMKRLLSLHVTSGHKAALDLPDSFTMLEWVIACLRLKVSILLLGGKDDPAIRNAKIRLFEPHVLIEMGWAASVSYRHQFRDEIEDSIHLLSEVKGGPPKTVHSEASPNVSLYELNAGALTVFTAEEIMHRWDTQSRYNETATNSGSRVLCMAPLSRSFGLIDAVLYTMQRGGTIYFTPYYRKEEWIELLVLQRISHLYALSHQYHWYKEALALAAPYMRTKPTLIAEHTPLGADMDSFFMNRIGCTVISPLDAALPEKKVSLG